MMGLALSDAISFHPELQTSLVTGAGLIAQAPHYFYNVTRHKELQ